MISVDTDSFQLLLGYAGLTGVALLDTERVPNKSSDGSVSAVRSWTADDGWHISAVLATYADEQQPSEFIWTIPLGEQSYVGLDAGDESSVQRWLSKSAADELLVCLLDAPHSESAMHQLHSLGETQVTNAEWQTSTTHVTDSEYKIHSTTVDGYTAWWLIMADRAAGVYGVQRGAGLPPLIFLCALDPRGTPS